MSKKLIIVSLVLIGVVCAGYFVWQAQSARANAARIESEILKGLTADEINLVLNGGSADAGSKTGGIAETVETRQAFLKGMREYLALAAEARREGMTDDPKFKINFEHKKNLLLADLYKTKLEKETGKNFVVPDEELKTVWANAQNEQQFETDMETLRSIQMEVAKERGDEQNYPKLQGESLIKSREKWARTKVLSDRAKADAEFAAKSEVQLRIKILEAGILSADYLRKHWAKIKATPNEASEYLLAHPEFDLSKKRDKADDILKRALAGEDFGKMAAEFSEDRSTKSKGGLYENIGRDALWIEVENAALSLQNGQVAPSIIETHTGYHIVKLDNKKSDTFSVRHILLQKAFEDPRNTNPDIPPPFISADEIAKAEIEKEKRNRFVDDAIRRNSIVLPEDFVAAD